LIRPGERSHCFPDSSTLLIMFHDHPISDRHEGNRVRNPRGPLSEDYLSFAPKILFEIQDENVIISCEFQSVKRYEGWKFRTTFEVFALNVFRIRERVGPVRPG